ncbi:MULTISPECIES: ABC transporter ATP-binding protein [Nocardiopsis]|uniref:ABC-2 type transport system ATP-binding protein n=1 Tax=Nocardiopsis sinuspersici TaxID=501010 RepID=A0A7Y9XDF5_9ACTN|nr:MULTISPECIES: ABC transporter ATP-binding protein [Nocardiopsis]NYH52720.1 ABC-2 type transport system ATP-binding protein [Nocardiopsis sinuspersici]
MKTYKRGVRANDGVTIQVGAGEVVGLLGHNGAGKTTLINQVAGLTVPTSGTIRVDGCDPVAEPSKVRRMIAVMPQSHAPLTGVTPRQVIKSMARIRGMSKSAANTRTEELIEALDLGEWADTTGERLSGGVRRLTAFGMAAASPGQVVMLDEPTNDVDPARRRLLWEQIRGLANRGCAVLLVTHNVVEAERSVDRIVVLDSGKVMAEGTAAQLRSRAAGDLRLELTAADIDGLPSLPEHIATAGPPLRASRRLTIALESSAAADALTWAQRLRASQDIDEFSLVPVGLEDVYLDLVGGESTSNGEEEG